jgi:hypothetical protein
MKKLFLYFTSSLFVLSCATVVKGGKETMYVTTEPQGANIVVKNKFGGTVTAGETPIVLNLDKGAGYFSGAEYFVEINKQGYQPRTVSIGSSVNGWYVAGNLIIGGLIGWLIVDPASGAMWTLAPDRSVASLTEEEKKALGVTTNTLKIVLLEDAPQNIKDKMVPVSSNIK